MVKSVMMRSSGGLQRGHGIWSGGDTVVQNLVGSFVTEFEEGRVKE